MSNFQSPMKHHLKITWRLIEIFYFDGIRSVLFCFTFKHSTSVAQCIIIFSSDKINHHLKMEILFQYVFKRLFLFCDNRHIPIKCSYFIKMTSFNRRFSTGKVLVSCNKKSQCIVEDGLKGGWSGVAKTEAWEPGLLRPHFQFAQQKKNTPSSPSYRERKVTLTV